MLAHRFDIRTGHKAVTDAHCLVLTVHGTLVIHQYPYFAEREMIVEVSNGGATPMRTVSSPLYFSDASSAPTGGVPLAREDTGEVLRELGYDQATISGLVASGAVEAVKTDIA